MQLKNHLFRETLTEKIAELAAQPEFSWTNGRANYATDVNQRPAVKVAAANCSLDYDLWSGLRNPAMIGNYPIGFEEMWEYYANRRKQKTDESGRSTIFQTVQPYAEAKKQFNRVVIVSAMLPLATHVYEEYNQPIKERGMAPWEGYCKAWGEINQLLDRGITRTAYSVINDKRAVLVMNDETVAKISDQAVPGTKQGASHGVCKGGNYPQRSVAVLTGLGQFAVSRSVIRDEYVDGSPTRFIGVLRSIVIFDPDEVITDNPDNIRYIDDEWKNHLAELSDFTNAADDINRQRFCTYIPTDGENGCGKCIAFCPSNALINSSPKTDGVYSDRVATQTHRFWDGALQFDNASCCDERGQLSELYSEWMCGRCVSICGSEGVLREQAISAGA